MRRLILFAVCCSGIFLNSFSQPTLAWLKTIDSPSESAGSVAVDNLNNSYAAAINGNTTYITKRDVNGKTIWAKSASSSYLEGIVKMFVDPSGNPVVAGFQYTNSVNGIVARGVIVRKFTAAGDSVYRTIVPGLFTYLDGGDVEHPGNNQTKISVVMDAAGNLYFGTAGDAGKGKGFLAIKVSSAGKLVRITSQNFKQDTTGNPFYYAASIALKTNQLALTGTTKYKSANISTWLLDTAGKTIITNISKGIGGVDAVFDDTANVYVLGNGLNAASSSSSNDIWLYKLNKSGKVFGKAYNFSGAELAQKLIFTADKKLVILANIDSLTDDPLAPTYWLLFKLDLSGSLVWKQVPINGSPKTVIADGKSNIYVVGSGGPNTGDFLYGSYGVTIKYSPAGVKQWQSLLHLYNFTPVDISLGKDTSVFVISAPAATVARFLQKGNSSNCGVPANLKSSGIATTTATVTWNKVTDVFLYYLQYKTSASTEWKQVTADSARYILQGLQQGTQYDFRVEAVCATEPSGFSAAAQFKTTGTGYCASKGPNNNSQWIDGVQLGAINTYPSGPNNGYKDFTNLSANLTRGSTYTITTNKYNLGGFGSESWRIWIDYNHDGDFDDVNELIVQYSNNYNYDYHNFTVPANALTGTTRMRVSMKAGSVYSTPCETFAEGEVEDYTVNIITSAFATSKISNINQVKSSYLSVSPNPVSGIVQVSGGDFKKQAILHIFDVTGRKILSKQINALPYNLNVDNLKQGIYMIRISDKDGNNASMKFIRQ